jgi:cytochrome c2
MRLAFAALAVVCLALAFASGAYAYRWALSNKFIVERYKELQYRFGPQSPKDMAAPGNWTPKETTLAKIETFVIRLPNLEGWGGGLQPLDGSRILYATRTGKFGLIGADGMVKELPFKIEMNLDALKRHPAYSLPSFQSLYVRVTDINLNPVGANRYQLLVGYHHFDPDRQCMEYWLGRGEVSTANTDVVLSRPFETVMVAKPCITFNGPGYINTFEGLFSGGRIVRLDDDHVLLSTGDHGWVGMRGYPALSQEDDSQLGKILLINVTTREVQIYAKGFRNPQGLTRDSQGRIWETEQGPRGGDELNLVTRGQNYGWPFATYGTDYGPLPWSVNAEQGHHNFGVKPQFSWSPDIGVSNLIAVDGHEFPLWQGDLLVASLTQETLHRLHLEGDRVVYDEPIDFAGSRLRDIVQLPNGHLALLSDNGTVTLVRNADRPGKPPFLDVSRQKRRSVDMTAEERALAVAGPYANGAQPIVAVPEHLTPQAQLGAAVFQSRCAMCHSLTSSDAGIGPSLNGVVGRRVGATAFGYSAGFEGKKESWTPHRIVTFASDPANMYSGTRMPSAILSSDEKRELESYLDLAGRGN